LHFSRLTKEEWLPWSSKGSPNWIDNSFSTTTTTTKTRLYGSTKLHAVLVWKMGSTSGGTAMTTNTLSINTTTYTVTNATFRFLADDGDGMPGWEFDVRTAALDYEEGNPLSTVQPRFYAEGDPIPLENLADLTGVELKLEEPFDADGEVYFTLYVYEHGDLRNLTLKFLERDGSRYRMALTATIPAKTVLQDDAILNIATWIDRLPEGS
jgi:hypothetical protein